MGESELKKLHMTVQNLFQTFFEIKHHLGWVHTAQYQLSQMKDAQTANVVQKRWLYISQ